MDGALSFRAAAELSLAELAELYTRCFAGYAYPVLVEPDALARRVRAEQIDLALSPVLCVGGEPAGVALLGVRGAETNCGGFGVVAPQRGRGLAHLLLAEHLRLARAASGRRFSLMVLAENGGALRTYQRAGMRVTRRLLWLEWRAPLGDKGAAPGREAAGGVSSPGAAAAPPAALLAHFAALPRAAPFWQRDLPTLRALDGLEGWQIPGAGGPAAYALVDRAPAGGGQILDLAARSPELARRLITALQSHYGALAINEPEESALVAPLAAAGFATALTRYELELGL